MLGQRTRPRFSEALAGKNGNLWLGAATEECNRVTGQNTIYLEELPEGCKVVGLRWVFKTNKD